MYFLGDPESAEADTADELAGIHRDAFAKPGKKGMSPSCHKLLTAKRKQAHP